MQVDIHMEDNDNYEEEQPHIVENSNLVRYLNLFNFLNLMTVQPDLILFIYLRQIITLCILKKRANILYVIFQCFYEYWTL